jgi:hypothetical protein
MEFGEGYEGDICILLYILTSLGSMIGKRAV